MAAAKAGCADRHPTNQASPRATPRNQLTRSTIRAGPRRPSRAKSHSQASRSPTSCQPEAPLRHAASDHSRCSLSAIPPGNHPFQSPCNSVRGMPAAAKGFKSLGIPLRLQTVPVSTQRDDRPIGACASDSGCVAGITMRNGLTTHRPAVAIHFLSRFQRAKPSPPPEPSPPAAWPRHRQGDYQSLAPPTSLSGQAPPGRTPNTRTSRAFRKTWNDLPRSGNE